MEPPCGFGVTEMFMGSNRWKLNWHFNAHPSSQVLGRYWSCFLPASPTITYKRWNKPTEAAGKRSLCLLKAWGTFTITDSLGPIPVIIIVIFLGLRHLWQYPLLMGRPQQPVPFPSELTAAVDMCRQIKTIFQNQTLEAVCLCYMQTFVF